LSRSAYRMRIAQLLVDHSSFFWARCAPSRLALVKTILRRKVRMGFMSTVDPQHIGFRSSTTPTRSSTPIRHNPRRLPVQRCPVRGLAPTAGRGSSLEARHWRRPPISSFDMQTVRRSRISAPAVRCDGLSSTQPRTVRRSRAGQGVPVVQRTFDQDGKNGRPIAFRRA